MAYIETSDLQNLGYSELPSNLSDICEAASDLADNFCYQSLGKTTDEEILEAKFRAERFTKVFPRFLPIVKINFLYSYYNSTNYTILTENDYEIDNRTGCVLISSAYYGRIKINYDHGYETIPLDAKRAVISIASNLISDFIRRKQFNLEGVSELTDDKQKVKFFDTTSEEDIPNSAKKILMKYRRQR